MKEILAKVLLWTGRKDSTKGRELILNSEFGIFEVNVQVTLLSWDIDRKYSHVGTIFRTTSSITNIPVIFIYTTKLMFYEEESVLVFKEYL